MFSHKNNTMKQYDVYFEIFGKKMRTKVVAENEAMAKKEIFSKIVFHKIEKPKNDFNDGADVLESIKNMFNM